MKHPASERLNLHHQHHEETPVPKQQLLPAYSTDIRHKKVVSYPRIHPKNATLETATVQTLVPIVTEFGTAEGFPNCF